MSINNKFAERLKELREDKNLSRMDLANELKISEPCISRWERGLRNPSIDSIILLCNYFGCTADFIIGLKDY